MHIIVENFQKIDFLLNNAPQMKAENMYNSDWAWKNRFCLQKKFQFFWFFPDAWGPQKFSTLYSLSLLKNKHQNCLPLTLQLLRLLTKVAAITENRALLKRQLFWWQLLEMSLIDVKLEIEQKFFQKLTHFMFKK